MEGALIDFESEILDGEDTTTYDINNYFKNKLAQFHQNIKDKSVTDVNLSESTTEASRPTELSTDLLGTQLDLFLRDFQDYKNKKEDDLINFESDEFDSVSVSESESSSQGDDDDEEQETDENEESTDGEGSGEIVADFVSDDNVDANKTVSCEYVKEKVEQIPQELNKKIHSVKVEVPTSSLLDLDEETFNKQFEFLSVSPSSAERDFSGNFRSKQCSGVPNQEQKNKNELKPEKGMIIIKKGGGKFECTRCFVVLMNRSDLLIHCQSSFHQSALKSRFEVKTEGKSACEVDNSPQCQPSTTKSKVKHVKKDNVSSNNKLVHAMGMACIQPKSENQMYCTMCNSIIPVAKEFENLMKNISHHIQGTKHINNLKSMEEKIDAIKKCQSLITEHCKNTELDEKNEPEKESSADVLRKPYQKSVYKFICLTCNFKGYGFAYCKSHMESEPHKNNVKKIMDSKSSNVPFEIVENRKCITCQRALYGPLSFYLSHKNSCHGRENEEKEDSNERDIKFEERKLEGIRAARFKIVTDEKKVSANTSVKLNTTQNIGTPELKSDVFESKKSKKRVKKIKDMVPNKASVSMNLKPTCGNSNQSKLPSITQNQNKRENVDTDQGITFNQRFEVKGEENVNLDYEKSDQLKRRPKPHRKHKKNPTQNETPSLAKQQEQNKGEQSKKKKKTKVVKKVDTDDFVVVKNPRTRPQSGATASKADGQDSDQRVKKPNKPAKTSEKEDCVIS